MAYINVDSINIYYEEFGNPHNPTIVYFHGGPGEGCWSYAHEAELLSEKYHVITFDQYGVMRSDPITEKEPFGVMNHVDLIDKMRAKLNIDTWTVLGHSFGGMLALLYTDKYSSHVDSVIFDCPMWNILNTCKDIVTAVMPYFNQHNNTVGINLCNQILQGKISSKEAYEKVRELSALMTDNEEANQLTHVIDQKLYEKYMTPNKQRVQITDDENVRYLTHTQNLLDNGDFYHDCTPLLPEIKVPALLLVGEYDVTCSKEDRKCFLNANIGKMVMIKNCAHLIWVEKPDAYNKEIMLFLDELKK